jgi:DNA polymerase III epsilon subunit-like protein
MLQWFNTPWPDVPVVFIDTETTGKNPGVDRAVQIGIARFQGGQCCARFSALVNPGMPIPSEATAIHGITDEDVSGAPPISEVFALQEVRAMLADAQPAAYNAPFDKHFVPPFGEDWTWPWLDTLSLVRHVDAYVRGPGRHKLANAAERHGVPLEHAHHAASDAVAAGVLFYKLAPGCVGVDLPLGQLLRQQMEAEAAEWFRFHDWLSWQPPRQAGAA